jgi:DnaJ-class molecular chaperone
MQESKGRINIMDSKQKIVICEKCKGTGKVDIGHHEFEWEDCSECNGLGRLREIITYEKLNK